MGLSNSKQYFLILIDTTDAGPEKMHDYLEVQMREIAEVDQCAQRDQLAAAESLIKSALAWVY